MLVELQALSRRRLLSSSPGPPVGFDGASNFVIAAILEKHMKLQLAEQDLFSTWRWA